MKTNTMTTQQLVYGFGINDLNETVTKNGSHLKFYSVWSDMFQRCYSDKFHTKNPTYVGCSVCDDWLSLSTFKVWFGTNYREGMSLDKDILIQGNKVYSPDTCRFVPHHINSLLTDAKAIRGELPLGISILKPGPNTRRTNITYLARCSNGNGKRLTKVFKTVSEARQWYITTKKKIVKEIVLESFWRNEIMSDVATALLEREW